MTTGFTIRRSYSTLHTRMCLTAFRRTEEEILPPVCRRYQSSLKSKNVGEFSPTCLHLPHWGHSRNSESLLHPQVGRKEHSVFPSGQVNCWMKLQQFPPQKETHLAFQLIRVSADPFLHLLRTDNLFTCQLSRLIGMREFHQNPHPHEMGLDLEVLPVGVMK